jgi:branched-chain amino acid transport system permease protein
MSTAYQYYVITLLVYLGVNTIACWALNVQYGMSGVLNFAFILFQAAGAYVTGVLTLGPASSSGFQTYILGASLPFPVPWLAATAAGGLLALAVGSFALRPARRDYQAMVMLVVSIIAATLVVSESSWFNGQNGLAAIPKPFADRLNLDLVGYGWFYVALTGATVLVVYAFVHRIGRSPWGRRLRAMRDDAEAVEALGANVRAESMKVYVIGGALAALSGAVLVQFIGAWAPGSWGTAETFLYFVAIIVGGAGNSFGAMLGAVLVLGVFQESLRYLPSFGYTGLAEAIQFMCLGVLILAFLWWRPGGLVPERRRRLAAAAVRAGTAGPPAHAAVARTDAPALEVDSLRVDFGGVHAVDGASFAVAANQVTGLIGPNGAGKSTALKLIAGALDPTDGRVRLDGADVTGWSAHALARRGLIRTFQLSSEFAHLTVLENLLVAAPGQRASTFLGAMRSKRYWRGEQAALLGHAWRLLEDFDMTEKADELAGRLSGGQKRLVEIMRALMARPRVLLLDEPLAGVNPTLRLRIEEHLMRLRETGLTMVMVEHELATVERCCDSVIVMARGRVLARGSMHEMRSNPEVVDAYLVG